MSDLSEYWAPFLLMGGGLVAALTMGWESIRDWDREASRGLVSLEMLLAVIGIAALVVGFVLLFV